MWLYGGHMPMTFLFCFSMIPLASYRRAKLGQIQGGVAEGQPRLDKGGGVAIIFYFFTR